MNNPRTHTQGGRGRAAFPGPGDPGGPAAAANSFVEGEALFLASLPVIDDITGQVCRRHRLSATEADDFRSEVRLHFIDRDYEVLRRFERRSSLPTYVTVVIQRLFLDYRNRQWGKWRPSADARRQGPTAILVERLVVRDGWTIEQVTETLRVNHGVTMDEALQALCDKLARRGPKRHLVAEDQAHTLESSDAPADANVVRAEQGFLAKRVRAALHRALHALDAESRLILKMRFVDSMPVADIARAQHLDQKRLYRRIEHLLLQISKSLEAEGISRADARMLFAEGALSWSQDREPDTSMVALTERVRTSWRQR